MGWGERERKSVREERNEGGGGGKWCCSEETKDEIDRERGRERVCVCVRVCV